MTNNLKKFLERAEKKELAIFGELMTETVQNLSQGNLSTTSEQQIEAELEEEQEEEMDENACPLISEFKYFDPNTTADSIVQEPEEGMMCVELVNDRVIIQGPYGQPFRGGFEILHNGNLIYIAVVSQRERFKGFEGTVIFQVHSALWKFLHYVAGLCNDLKATPEFKSGGGGGYGNSGGNGNGNGNGGGGEAKQGQSFEILDQWKHLMLIPSHRVKFYTCLSIVTSAPATPGTATTMTATTGMSTTSTTTATPGMSTTFTTTATPGMLTTFTTTATPGMLTTSMTQPPTTTIPVTIPQPPTTQPAQPLTTTIPVTIPQPPTTQPA